MANPSKAAAIGDHEMDENVEMNSGNENMESTLEEQFHQAVEDEDYEKLKKLIGQNVDLNSKRDYDKTNQTALHKMSQEGNLEMLKFLLENGAQVDARARVSTPNNMGVFFKVMTYYLDYLDNTHS